MKKQLILIACVLFSISAIYFWDAGNSEDQAPEVKGQKAEFTKNSVESNQSNSEKKELSDKSRQETTNKQNITQNHSVMSDTKVEDTTSELKDENDDLDSAKIHKVINNNELFQDLMEEMQTPIKPIDLEIYQHTYDTLAQILALSKYNYRHGCSNEICAIEVNFVDTNEATELSSLILEKSVMGPMTYQLAQNDNGGKDIRIIFNANTARSILETPH